MCPATPTTTRIAVELRELPPQATAVVTASIPSSKIAETIGRMFGLVMAELGRLGMEPVGMPFARYFTLGPERIEFEAGFPVPSPIGAAGEVHPGALPGGLAAVAWHIGPYQTLESTYHALEAWVHDHGHAMNGAPWESYHSEPEVPPEQTRTEVFFPITP